MAELSATPQPEVAKIEPSPAQPEAAPAVSVEPQTQIARAEPPAVASGGAPAQALVAPPTMPVMPSFDVVRVEPSGDAVIAGVAAPGSMVEVLDDGKPVARAKANESGDWALALDRPLAPGTHDLAIRTTSGSISKRRSSAAASRWSIFSWSL